LITATFAAALDVEALDMLKPSEVEEGRWEMVRVEEGNRLGAPSKLLHARTSSVLVDVGQLYPPHHFFDMDDGPTVHSHLQSTVDENQVQALRTRRNALTSPLCRLSTDALHYILEIIETQQRHDDTENKGTWQKTWISTLFVCTSIRALAVQSPALWSYINLSRSEKWADLCVERARAIPLELHYEVRVITDWALHYLGTLLSRASKVQLVVHKYRYVASVLNTAAPLLHTLSLSIKAPHYFLFSLAFLGGTTTLLTHLKLGRVNIAADPPVFPGLKSLHLSSICSDGKPHHLLRLVGSSHALEELTLKYIFITLPDIAYDRLSLPHLRVVRVTADALWTKLLLEILPIAYEVHSFEITIDRRNADITLEDATSYIRAYEAFLKVTEAVSNSTLDAQFEYDSFWLDMGRTYPALTIQTPTGSIPNMSYKTVHIANDRHDFIMRRLITLAVHGSVVGPFFLGAALKPVETYVSLTSIAIHGDQQHLDRRFRANLEGWLLLRKESGEVLDALSIQIEMPPGWPMGPEECPSSISFIVWMRTLVKNTLVKDAFLNGDPVVIVERAT
jgi:hypothetical protein